MVKNNRNFNSNGEKKNILELYSKISLRNQILIQTKNNIIFSLAECFFLFVNSDRLLCLHHRLGAVDLCVTD